MSNLKFTLGGRTVATGAIGIVLFLLFAAASLAVAPWVLMLLIGAIHSGVASVPALGFGTVFAIYFTLFLLANLFKSKK